MYKSILIVSLSTLCFIESVYGDSEIEYEPDGFYLGGQFGVTDFDNACEDSALSCDHGTSALGFYGGYHFASRWSIEGGYFDLGEAEAVYPRLMGTNVVQGEIQGYNLSLLYTKPINASMLSFVRLGAFQWETQNTSPEFEITEKDWSATAGIGLAWKINPAWQARVQYQAFPDLGDDLVGRSNGQVFWFGLSYIWQKAAKETYRVSAPASPPTSSPSPTTSPTPSPLATILPTPVPTVTPSSETLTSLPVWRGLVYFDFDSSKPLNIEVLAPLLQRLQMYPNTVVEVIGFTDDQGNREYNLALSRRRAEAVANYLIREGIEQKRVSVFWKGQAEIVTGADPQLEHAVSRRVVVRSPAVVSTHSSGKPLGDDRIQARAKAKAQAQAQAQGGNTP